MTTRTSANTLRATSSLVGHHLYPLAISRDHLNFISSILGPCTFGVKFLKRWRVGDALKANIFKALIQQLRPQELQTDVMQLLREKLAVNKQAGLQHLEKIILKRAFFYKSWSPKTKRPRDKESSDEDEKPSHEEQQGARGKKKRKFKQKDNKPPVQQERKNDGTTVLALRQQEAQIAGLPEFERQAEGDCRQEGLEERSSWRRRRRQQTRRQRRQRGR
ncbi:hypothetical protein SDRG_01801 [Saprolegnia diclina VS20]|uniref:Uncharacterized protein n=1 Tax=Saprolegnia diclina (strain VS20) TaxID=1156394 RepID=T0QRF8_SAPDV|nr:hypothetical protein SDRG_01801 [Saprolegnia diclina VS20]EQC40729.1 hypothetical protein SDRG_01801 [Saprolegnia diclina VS20]|eukprot:XP_008605573.1 hypothetical protein SDRG_01801 [Saprolegnia diclina VS20]